MDHDIHASVDWFYQFISYELKVPPMSPKGDNEVSLEFCAHMFISLINVITASYKNGYL